MDEKPTAASRGTEKPVTLADNLYIWLQALVGALVVIVVVFTFLARVIFVDGSSMVPTLHNGDMILLQAIGYTPKIGDVVVLTQKSYGDVPLVKRVVATGGQTVDVDYAANTVTVTDPDGSRRVLQEDYLGEPMVRPAGLTADHIEVPVGSICVFGDNRNNSTDSRSPLVGTVDVRCVLGRAHFIVLPFSHMGVIR